MHLASAATVSGIAQYLPGYRKKMLRISSKKLYLRRIIYIMLHMRFANVSLSEHMLTGSWKNNKTKRRIYLRSLLNSLCPPYAPWPHFL